MKWNKFVVIKYEMIPIYRKKTFFFQSIAIKRAESSCVELRKQIREKRINIVITGNFLSFFYHSRHLHHLLVSPLPIALLEL